MTNGGPSYETYSNVRSYLSIIKAFLAGPSAAELARWMKLEEQTTSGALNVAINNLQFRMTTADPTNAGVPDRHYGINFYSLKGDHDV